MANPLFALMFVLPVLSQAELTMKPVLSQNRADNKLLVGNWKFTNSQGCTDTVTYRADGIGRVTSQDEITDFTYLIQPADKTLIRHKFIHVTNDLTDLHSALTRDPIETRYGIYQVSYETLKDNGGIDCFGSKADNTGQSRESFYVFNKNNTAFFFCIDLKFPCIGPYRKQPE